MAMIGEQPDVTSTAALPNPVRRCVLVTGAAGQVGQVVAARLADRYDLILTDIRPLARPSSLPFVQADITNLDALRPLCHGVDTVLHLAVANMHASWESLLPSNIVGVYNIFQAAHFAGCRRVIFASSIQAVDGATPDLAIPSGAPVQPSTLYGATKAWGEAAGYFFARQYGYSVICLRLGWVTPRDGRCVLPGNRGLRRVITYEDLMGLMAAAIDAPEGLDFAILNGISNNRQKRLDISETQRILGYAPQDDAFVLAEYNRRSLWHRGRRLLENIQRLAQLIRRQIKLS